MRLLSAVVVLSLQLVWPLAAWPQVVFSGRIYAERVPGSGDMMAMTAVRCYASLDGPGSQSMGSRTWETDPVGWYTMTGPAGNYTLVYSSPDHFMRPIVMTNAYTRPGDKLDRIVTPTFDCAVFNEQAWDGKAAGEYYQTFVAKGASVTQVGFRAVHDGVDGIGPGSQNLLASIRRGGTGTPDTWEQVGPTMPVLNVDSGGPKNYLWSAGWNSGEVPTTPGLTYAVHLKAESDSGTFQLFWRPDPDKKTQGDCYRIGKEGTTGFQDCDAWIAVSSDSDGLVIPYNKRVHKMYGEFAGGGRKWSQTYVAQGRSVASVILYAAVSGRQPSQNRQRLAVRVRQGGPQGPVVGTEKIATGNALYTGDASWGTFGVAFAPGEVPLEPGRTYAIEFETLENWETLHDFRDIKNHPPDENPGFNPYRKFAPDTYEPGKAYREGKEEVDYDLDMQVIEYAFSGGNWTEAVDGGNLLKNGDMESGEVSEEDPGKGRCDAWKPFAVDPATLHAYVEDGKARDNRIIRVLGGSITGKPADGGYVQRVDGLSRLETYRLSGRVRSSWVVDEKHQCDVGFDPTGQDEDPNAGTIVWTTLPKLHGIFVPYLSEPIRPGKDAVSVWLRGRTTLTIDMPFKADFDDFTLRRVATGVPRQGP